MDIKSQEIGDVTVIEIFGKIDTNTSPDAQRLIDEKIEGGAAKLLIDLGQVEFVSSTGLRVFLVTAKRLNGSGGSLHLCGLNETVNEIFEISGFSTILDVFPNRDEALAAF
jgi:anti-sigma B factor antagonist